MLSVPCRKIEERIFVHLSTPLPTRMFEPDGTAEVVEHTRDGRIFTFYKTRINKQENGLVIEVEALRVSVCGLIGHYVEKLTN